MYEQAELNLAQIPWAQGNPETRACRSRDRSMLRVDSAQWLPHPNPVWSLHATNVGGIEQLVLQDGTRVDLNTDSEVKVRFTGGGGKWC